MVNFIQTTHFTHPIRFVSCLDFMINSLYCPSSADPDLHRSLVWRAGSSPTSVWHVPSYLPAQGPLRCVLTPCLSWAVSVNQPVSFLLSGPLCFSGNSLSHLPFRNHFCVYNLQVNLCPSLHHLLMPVLCNSPEALWGCRLRLLSLGTSSLVAPTGLLLPFVTSPLPLVSRCSGICLQWDPSPALYPARQRSSAPRCLALSHLAGDSIPTSSSCPGVPGG